VRNTGTSAPTTCWDDGIASGTWMPKFFGVAVDPGNDMLSVMLAALMLMLPFATLTDAAPSRGLSVPSLALSCAIVCT